MENFDFENNIKQGLENINPMLDNDEIWDNIEPHLKKKKKRRLIFWLFFGVLGLLGLLWFQASNTSNDNALHNVERIEEIKSTSLAQNAKSTTSQNETVEVNENATIDNIQVLKKETPIDKNIGTKPQINDLTSNPAIKAKTSTRKAERVRTTVNEVKPNIKITSPPTSESAVNVGSGNQNIIPSIAMNINEEVNRKVEIEIDPAIDKVDSPQSTTIAPPTKIETPQEKIEEPNQNPALIIKNEPVENVPVENVPVAEKNLTKEERAKANKKRKEERKRSKEEREKKKKEERDKAKKEKNALTKPNKSPKWKYQAQILGSGIYTIHSLKDRNQSESAYLENRSKYVTGTEGFGTELRFAAESPSGFILTAGIQYQELHEKLNRQETEIKSELQNVTETVTEDREGNIIGSTSGMQLVTTTTTYNQQLYNQYRFINFPFGVGYTFKNRKMRLKLIGGIDLNAYYKFSGSLFDRSLSIIELNSTSSSSYSSRFKNTLGIGIWTSLEWHKPLNEKLSLFIAPAIQAPIGAISQNSEEWPISHKIIKLKLGVGINYILGGIKNPKKSSRSRKG